LKYLALWDFWADFLDIIKRSYGTPFFLHFWGHDDHSRH
jgi:hypothetical protein